MATNTKYIKFSKIESMGKDAHTIIKLMMVFNDIALANEGLSKYKALGQDDVDRGKAMYYVRLQASHIYEGIDVLKEVIGNQNLNSLLSKCSSESQKAFSDLIKNFQDNAEKRKFERFIGRLGNNLTFHYEESSKFIEKYISVRAKNRIGDTSSITRGDNPHSWRYTVADNLIDSIACREIWGIPDSADLRVEADKVADYMHQIFLDFTGFSSEFINKYLEI